MKINQNGVNLKEFRQELKRAAAKKTGPLLRLTSCTPVCPTNG